MNEQDSQRTTQQGGGDSIFRGGIRRSMWICRNARQRVVLARDGSSSMDGQKAADAFMASQDLVSELARPVNRDGFSIAVLDFATTSRVANALEKATALEGKVASLQTGGTTNITAALRDALVVLTAAESSAEEGVSYLRPVVILFSGGRHNEGEDPRGVAQLLKNKADLVTIAFGSDADETALRSLASSPQHFYRCANGRELRSFLAVVGATLTATIGAGVNASASLANVRQ